MNSYDAGMKSTVSEKGQVTIPKRLRDKLGIRGGTVLDFDEEEGVLVARKESEIDLFRKWRGRGRLPGEIGVDAYLTRSRE
jgi:AbrB family looped-hinge helix DNA binding protein